MLHFWTAQAWITQLLHCKATPYLPLPRSSPEGATTERTVIAPSDDAYYSFIDSVRMAEFSELALLADLQQTVYP